MKRPASRSVKDMFLVMQELRRKMAVKGSENVENVRGEPEKGPAGPRTVEESTQAPGTPPVVVDEEELQAALQEPKAGACTQPKDQAVDLHSNTSLHPPGPSQEQPCSVKCNTSRIRLGPQLTPKAKHRQALKRVRVSPRKAKNQTFSSTTQDIRGILIKSRDEKGQTSQLKGIVGNANTSGGSKTLGSNGTNLASN